MQSVRTHQVVLCHLKVGPADLVLGPPRRQLRWRKLFQYAQRFSTLVHAHLLVDRAKRAQETQQTLARTSSVDPQTLRQRHEHTRPPQDRRRRMGRNAPGSRSVAGSHRHSVVYSMTNDLATSSDSVDRECLHLQFESLSLGSLAASTAAAQVSRTRPPTELRWSCCWCSQCRRPRRLHVPVRLRQ